MRESQRTISVARVGWLRISPKHLACFAAKFQSSSQKQAKARSCLSKAEHGNRWDFLIAPRSTNPLILSFCVGQYVTPEEFTQAIYTNIVEGNAQEYQDILEACDRSTITDEYWKRVTSLFDLLNDQDKKVLSTIFRQVAVDSIASVLAVLDSSSQLGEAFQEFSLKDSSGSTLSGDLHDYFLAIDEKIQEE